MVLTDQNGLPLSGIIDSAQKAEVNLALETIDAVSVPIRPQHDKKRPEKLVADKAYDAKWLRDEIKRRSIQPSIPKRRKKGQSEEPKYNQTIKGDYRKRWIVERTFAWLGWSRRLLVRWERLAVVYQGFFTLACIMICLRKVLK